MTTITLLSFPTEGNDKVAGIKAVRAFTGLGLKEAKDIIDDLQAGQSSTFNIEPQDARQDAIKAFEGFGGRYQVVDFLPRNIRKSIDMALDNGLYDIAADLIAILKKTA